MLYAKGKRGTIHFNLGLTILIGALLRGYIKLVESGVSACKKIGCPDANKCYRYQFRKDSTTGNHKK